MRYADPNLCPDCRSSLTKGAPVCPTCDLLVRHPVAVTLFDTLRSADTLVATLRTASEAFHDRPTPQPATTAPAATRVNSLGGPVAAPATPPAPKRAVPGPAGPPAPPYPGPQHPSAGGGGMALTSIPKILLGLGAACLLVAAVIFLAVSWSVLGLGGRTAVLAGLTLTFGASALFAHRLGLRIAGESLSVVSLGLLALDVFGAGAADWFGDLSGGATTCAAGLVVAAAATALSLLRIGDRPRLVAPQVIAGLALWVAHLGLLDATRYDAAASHAITALALALIVLGRRQDLGTLQWSATAAGVFAWLAAGATAALDAAATPTAGQLWVDGSGWSLLVTAAVLVLPGLIADNRTALTTGAGAAVLVLTATLTLPSIDEGATAIGLVALAVTAGWVLVLAALPTAARPIAIAPATGGSLLLLGLTFLTTTIALVRWLETTVVFARRPDVVLGGADPVTAPLLTIPSLLVPLALVALLTPDRSRAALTAWWLPLAGIVIGVGGAITLTSYDVALAAPVGALVLTALGAATVSLMATGRRATGFATLAVVVGCAAAVAALASPELTALAAGLVTAALAALTLLAKEDPARFVGGLALSPVVALAVSGTVFTTGGDAAWLAVPVLLVVGILAVALARPEIEALAVATTLFVLPISVEATADRGGLTALWLAVAGLLACASALLHPSRRSFAWVGAPLLLLATWVRLADLDVTQPEAYTLPLAAALLAFGGWRMHRNPALGSAEALTLGLLVATVPSLLWVLGAPDPVSLRALLLGGACLALTVAGATLRWSAPLTVGSVVGGVLVLRELGPYASDVPTWVWIGLAGTLLTVVGITWERRLLDLRSAAGYLGRLR